MLIGTALTSHVSPTTGYVLDIALPMLVFGIGQGLGLSTLTTAGMAGVAPRDAGVVGALVNVAHHLGGALGLGILITVFGTAGAQQHGRLLLAERVSTSLTAACVLLVLALVVTVLARPCRPGQAPARVHDTATAAATASLAHPGADTLSDCRA
jgi:sugar phosphate permease